jgi:TonB-dependent starch-binding outer membrane protein SusC
MKLNSMRLKSLFILLLLIIVQYSFAQQKTISGKVTDQKSSESLPGVTIMVVGTTTGTVTDLDGNYSIAVKNGDVLEFSYVGYKKQDITVSSQNIINVELGSEIKDLGEVVVIGYGTVKKSDATGSVTAVSSKDFNKGSITSAQDLLVGKTAGVVITNAGGAPGSGATIRIRGGSSLNASNDPLIIIDGVPIDNNNIGGSSNFLSFINPNDIETFTVLKDASATAIYGSRASNGVILITTKKGTTGKTIQVNYDINTSVSSAIKFVDVYTGDEF